jgi:hypothetical protein
MSTLMQSEIFFFISSIGFIIIGILGIIIIILCIKVIRSFMRILERIESSMDTIGDVTMELIEDMRYSVFFRMFFRPRRKHPSRETKEKLEN